MLALKFLDMMIKKSLSRCFKHILKSPKRLFHLLLSKYVRGIVFKIPLRFIRYFHGKMKTYFWLLVSKPLNYFFESTNLFFSNVKAMDHQCLQVLIIIHETKSIFSNISMTEAVIRTPSWSSEMIQFGS